MTYLQGALLGVLQGMTEFLPISSTAHLRIFSELFGWQDPGAAFTAVTQLGTETAVLVYFRRDISNIIRAWFASIFRKAHTPESRLGWLVIVGTLPIGVLGLIFQDTIETTFRNLYLIAAALLIFSAILYLADRRAGQRELSSLSVRDGLALGMMQALALIPGVSRSGGTIAGGLFLGLNRVAAARYSFLLAIPAVLASAGLQATKISSDSSTTWGPTLVATVVAFAVALAVIAWLLRFISTHSFRAFIWYRTLLGIALLLLLTTGAI